MSIIVINYFVQIYLYNILGFVLLWLVVVVLSIHPSRRPSRHPSIPPSIQGKEVGGRGPFLNCKTPLFQGIAHSALFIAE
jgi:hypothetical protein